VVPSIPAIDLSQLTLGRPAHARLNTRIVVVNYPDDSGHTHLLGLIAEKATETVRRESVDFLASGVNTDRAPYLVLWRVTHADCCTGWTWRSCCRRP